MWLPPALLLLCLPGCWSLVGPRFVTGTTGDSLTIRCRYEKDYKGYNKYWCRGQYDTDCNKIVETQGTEREERSGRVSIRDNADSLTLTVTMENLNAADAGSYWCKIQTVWILDAWSRDPSFQVQVSVSPAPRTTTRRTTHPATTATFPTVTAGQNFSTNHCPGVPLSTVHFLLLIFLKLPLFLGVLGAVLWMSRCQKGPGGGQSRPDQGTPPRCPPAPGKPCPGIQTFRLDQRDLRALHSRAGRQPCPDSAGT
ncbi:CMRF35-like molecule 2 isoform X1 [Myotis daubentonii]|uniref:CMRF35-like molecule 2 isoform X1 n=1 Tax=Myotis daubentonii TaxID=98922 RepID=UPI0028735ADF|nr:CMRF35-like molecule 2 isoform X1 [Myotis daubentonii]